MGGPGGGRIAGGETIPDRNITDREGPTSSQGGEEARWRVVEIDGRQFRQLNLEHPEVGPRIVEEIESGIGVYYNQRWDQTRRFCRFLLGRPELVEGLRVFVAGAGVGMEAVVAGQLAAALTVNDRSPVALELQLEQLAANGVREARPVSGSFEEATLEGIDLVLACYVVYDDETRTAMERLVDRAGARGIPALLANEDLEGHFSRLLDSIDRTVTELDRDGGRYIVWIS